MSLLLRPILILFEVKYSLFVYVQSDQNDTIAVWAWCLLHGSCWRGTSAKESKIEHELYVLGGGIYDCAMKALHLYRLRRQHVPLVSPVYASHVASMCRQLTPQACVASIYLLCRQHVGR